MQAANRPVKFVGDFDDPCTLLKLAPGPDVDRLTTASRNTVASSPYYSIVATQPSGSGNRSGGITAKKTLDARLGVNLSH
ncbi:hypothetical protein D3C86_1798710 [compost metagenome]